MYLITTLGPHLHSHPFNVHNPLFFVLAPEVFLSFSQTKLGRKAAMTSSLKFLLQGSFWFEKKKEKSLGPGYPFFKNEFVLMFL